MATDDWSRVAAIAEAAIALPLDSRFDYVAAACGADARLAAEVTLLLTHHEEEETLRASAALEPLADGLSGGILPWIPDRFERLDYLGSGGFGTVYRAYDRVHRQWVALKVLRRADPTQLHRFKQEFRRTTSIHHRNVIRMHELFAEGDRWFFTMELVDGRALIDYIRGHGHPGGAALTAGALVRLRPAFQQLAEGVSALHAAGIVHGDLKPQNVVVTPDGRVVLLDFGLVRDITHQPSVVAGTPAYMAPELLTQEPASQAADWYSVGVLLYEALSGTLPFSGTLLDVLWTKLRAEVRLPDTGDYPAPIAALCRALLQRQPEERPGAPEIRQMLLELPAELPQPISASRPPFVGRQRHLEILRGAFRRVAEGRPTAVLVSGVSGIGKSTLLRHFIEAVRQEPEVVVLSGRCHESESVPFKALDEMVDALGRYLGGLEPPVVTALLPRDVRLLTRVFPTLLKVSSIAAHPEPSAETVGSQELRDRALSALIELLEHLAVRHRVVLWIDDLQWGDFDSLWVLRGLQQPGAPCLLLLLSYRFEEADSSPLLAAVFAAGAGGRQLGGVLDLRVDALERDEAQELAAALGAELTAEQRDGLIEETGGSPLFLSELARHVVGSRGAVGHPPALIEMIQQRVEGLPPSARLVLDVVAVAGQPLDREVVFRAADAGDASAEARLMAAFLVRAAGRTASRELDTYHDKVREAVLGLMPDQTQRDYHRRLALAVEASGHPDPERLVHHFGKAGIDDAAYRCAVQAARTAESCLAFDQAAALFRLALDVRARLPPDAQVLPTVHELQRSEAHALADAGRSAQAAAAYLRAADQADAREADDLRGLAVDQLMRGGQIDQGLALLTARLRAAGMRLPRSRRLLLAAAATTRLRVRMRGIRFRERPAEAVAPAVLARIDRLWTAGATLVAIDPLLGSYLRGRHLLLALRAGEPYRVSVGLSLEAIQRAMPGAAAYPAARRILDRARELAVECAQPYAEATLLTGEAGVAHFSGRIRDALRYGVQAEALLTAKCAGVSWELAAVRSLILAALNLGGQWKELAARLGTVLREAEANGDRYAQFALPLTVASYATFLAADDPAGARRELDYRLNEWARSEFDIPRWTHSHGTIETLLYEQHYAEAWQLVNQAWPGLQRTHMLRIEYIRVAAGHARARCAVALHSTAPRPELRAVAERFARHCGRSHSALSQGWGLLIDAALSASRGDRHKAMAKLHMAEDRLGAVGAVQGAAAGRRQRGRLTGGAAGAALIRSADAELAELGAVNPQRMADRLAPGIVDPGPAPPRDPAAR